jgi:hypothetical protein
MKVESDLREGAYFALGYLEMGVVSEMVVGRGMGDGS